MKNNVGLWIDHRHAVIVTLSGKNEALDRIESDVEKHVRYSGSPQAAGPEDQRDRRFAGHLNQYYDKVIAKIRQAESILVLGPGEAKGELKERLQEEGLGDRVVGVEATDKMTDPQLAALVRSHFQRA